MKKVRRFFGGQWQRLLYGGLTMVAVGSLLLFRLGSLTGGLSNSELRQQLFSSSWHHLWHNPLNLPLTGLQWLILTLIPHHGATVTRLASIALGALTLAAFAYVVRRWYGVRAALYGTILFGCSSWFLHTSRYAGLEVNYLLLVPLLFAVQIFWDRHSDKWAVNLGAIAVLSLLLYIPGSIWLVTICYCLQPGHARRAWQQLTGIWRRASLPVLAIFMITPLVIAFVKTPALIRTWLGLPTHFDSTAVLLKRLLHSVSYSGYYGPKQPLLWLDRLPVLDIFALVMVALGILFYARHFQAPRTRLLAAIIVASIVLFTLGGPVTYSLLVPLLYILASAGIGYLLHEWLGVFPRNPIARTVGYSALGFVVAVACFYNLRSYFIAWPHNPIVIQAYQHHDTHS